MNRLLFIKKLVATIGISAIPTHWVVEYDKFYLLQSFAAGFKFYKGPTLLDNMNAGDTLAVIREPDNEYDENAIALHWNGNKIGFIPQNFNLVLARLMDIKAIELHAEITHIEKRSQSWENVAIGIYCLKPRTDGQSATEAAQKLTVAANPDYLSLAPARQITRFKEEEQDAQVVININRMPARLEPMRKKYASRNEQEDCYFDEKGFRILDEADIERLIPEVKEIKNVADCLNQQFAEMVFDMKSV